eukprot:gene14944-16485_t
MDSLVAEESRSCDLTKLTKEELITKVERLIESNKKLKKQIKNINQKDSQKCHKKPGQRSFQFESCHQKKIALKLSYIGWDYQGFAFQDNTVKTIEQELFAALMKTCLIKDRFTCEYSRCGRTDKGVSAFGQVISLNVRAIEEGKGDPIDYVKVLNRVLPLEIRILAWTPISQDFDARFSCGTRTYKYFFPAANLDISAMNSACERLIGEHDFRNFCKVDVGNNVNHFTRKVLKCEINKCENKNLENSADDMHEITICGMAFLWHQVRCMVSVLFLIGLHLEKQEVIDELLDVVKYPKKPQYTMVSEIPLILFDCEFADVQWIYPAEQTRYVISQFQATWTNHAVSNKDKKQQFIPSSWFIGIDGIDRHLEKQAVKRKVLEERHGRKKKAIKTD